jgi:hypothetical protein
MATALASILSGGLLDGVSKVINSIRGKSPEDAAKLQELATKYQSDILQADLEQRKLDVQEQQMQADVNKQEAASNSVLVAGWRPFIGWVCGVALAFQFVVSPLLVWIGGMWHYTVQPPKLDMGDLLTVLAGMLGLGYMRTQEKLSGIKTGH